MRYAIISDIHGNLTALEQVIEQIVTENCDKIVCLGDIVGYGPFPNECIELVRKKADYVIAGNHDHAAAGLTGLEYFNEYARKAMEWTIPVLTSENKEYLKQLSLTADLPDAFFVHASPIQPERWGYVLTPDQALLNIDKFAQQCCFIGHSHLPVIFAWAWEGQPEMIYSQKLKFNKDTKYVVNVGSVGQPRDHNPKASFGIFDTFDNSFQFLRVRYDIFTTQKAMMALKFPEFLIERLKNGR